MKDKTKLVLAGAALAALVLRKKKSVAGVGETKDSKKKFYVYAGYYENYISSKPMPAPYVKRRTFNDINRAIDYAESFEDSVIYCKNVKRDLPDYIYEFLQDEDYSDY